MTADLPRLRRDLLAFRVTHPGTQASLRAAKLLADLPSPLDRLDASTIPAVEKFASQPRELVGVLGEHRGRHAGPVAAVAFSSDGSMIASLGGGYLRLWNPTTMRLIGVAGDGSAAVAFTPNSKNLVTANSGGTVHVWDLPKGLPPRLRFSVAAATSPAYSTTGP